MFKPIFLAFIALMLGGSLATAEAAGGNDTSAPEVKPASVNKNLCNNEWRQILQNNRTMEGRLQRWSSLNEKCANSGLYEARLTSLYTFTRQYDKAKKTAESGLALKTSYDKELRSALAGVYLDEQDLDSALHQYQVLIKAYPDWFDGYGGVGAVKLIQHKFDDAVHYLTEADKRGHALYIYEDLTIAYHELGRNKEAADELDKGYRYDKTIAADRDTMVAAARSYILLGRYDVADGLLKLLLRANPAVASDKQYVATVQFVNKKLQSSAGG
jgi:tetratricopeptide (TPR) repeat protein